MSDENKKADADDKAEEKIEATKKPAAKKKAKAKTKASEETESEGNKNKVIEKLQAMGVMSGGSSKMEEKSASGKSEFLKVTAASVVAVLVVSSFVWALNKEAGNDRSASNFNNAPQNNHPSQWGPYSANQWNGRNSAYNNVSQENNRKNHEKQQERMKQHREQQQK